MPTLTELRTAPEPIAFARILTGISAVMLSLEGYGFLSRIADGRMAVPYVTWLPDPGSLPLFDLMILGVLAGLGIAAGWFTRTCLIVTVGTELITLLTDQQTYSSHRFLLTIVCCHLLFARSDAAWSMTARRQGRRASVPLWPQLLILGAVSSCYAFAGLSKLNGIFLHGDVLRDDMIIGLPQAVYVGLACLTVVTEVFIGLGLWFARTRWIAVVLGLGLHASIVALLDSPFVLSSFALLCVGAYPLALTRTRWA